MKKFVQVLSVLLVMAGLAACNSDGKKSSDNEGVAVFFNYVDGAGQLRLEDEDADNRGFGDVDPESFGPGITLKSSTWELTVTDIQDESDGGDDITFLDAENFTVKKNDYRIFALIGTTSDMELVTLEVAKDDESGDTKDTNDDDIDDDEAQYINFSHILAGYGDLDIYLVEEDYSSTPLGSLEPTATVSYKGSTEDLRLPENVSKYYLRVAEAGTSTEIYKSTEQILKDALYQTIIIAPYTGSIDTGSVITAFYYGSSVNETWLDSDSEGQVRVFNAVQDSTDLDFVLAHSDDDVTIDADLSFLDLSSYQTVDTKGVTYVVEPVDSVEADFFDGGTGVPFNVENGESWTIIFLGRVDDNEESTAIAIKEEDRSSDSEATFTFTNAGYIFDDDDRDPIDIHVKLSHEHLDSSSVVFNDMGYGGHATTSLDNNTYEIYVANEDENNISSTFGPEIFTVEGGENIHFVLVEGGTPFQIIRLIGELNVKKSIVTADKLTPTTAETVTVTIQAKDFGANKHEVGGETLSITATGSAVASVITDNNDGTYTATVTNAVAEDVTIEVTYNSDVVDEEIIVSFTTP